MSQNDLVLNYMREFGSISPLEAFRDLGVMRLSARIANLKDRGIKIRTQYETRKNRYNSNVTFARYSIDG